MIKVVHKSTLTIEGHSSLYILKINILEFHIVLRFKRLSKLGVGSYRFMLKIIFWSKLPVLFDSFYYLITKR